MVVVLLVEKMVVVVVVENMVVVLVVEKMVVVLVVEGSDEQNDEVTDGTRPSWWRPLTECRPLYSTLPSTAAWGRVYQSQDCVQYITVEIWMARTISRWWVVGYWRYVWCQILRGVCSIFFIFQCARHGAELEVCTLLSEVCKEEVLVLEVVPPHPHFLPHSVGTPG